MSNGKLFDRLDRHDCEVITKDLVKLWLDEFKIDYRKNNDEAVEEWFGGETR